MTGNWCSGLVRMIGAGIRGVLCHTQEAEAYLCEDTVGEYIK